MMACTNMVMRFKGRKKGSGEPISKIKKRSWYSWWSAYLKVEQPEGLTPCPGKVEIEISASGGCACCESTEIEIGYQCDSCGCTFYPELPRTSGDLEDLLNTTKGFTKTEVKAMQEAHVKGYEEAEARAEQWREESRVRIAANRVKAAEKKKLVAEGKAARKKAAAAKKKAAKKE